MSAVDMTQRKLNFPPRFLPYLEKHRIFELFHECIELLVQVKPRDHIKFLKNVLPCAARKKDKQRIVFLAPKQFDNEAFGQMLANCLGIQPINRALMQYLTAQRMKKDEILLPDEQTVEEESCICPGEGGYISPMYYPAPEENLFLEEEKQSVEEPEEPPCICVCPCVGNDDKNKKDGKDEDDGECEEQDEPREYGEYGEGGEGWGGGPDILPCDGTEKDKHSRKKKSPIPVDYGMLAECDLAARGWILTDFPTSGKEAENLCQLGVLPTHAIRIIVNEEEEMKDRKYKWTVLNWMKIYKFVPVVGYPLQEIRLQNRTMMEFSSDMCKLLSVMPHRHAPMLPRIALIGSRGSGVTTQAEKLAKKYGIVHGIVITLLEFEIVIARALQQDDDLTKLYKQQLATRVEPEVEAMILEKALMSSSCRNRGWVLTGYPRNIDQMRMLDIMAAPPNRLIFIEVPARECFVRLFYRKIDPCLGDEYKLPTIEPTGLDSYVTNDLDPEVSARLLSHPKNNKKQIIHDIETYFLQKTEMMNYCGKTASYVDGNKTVDIVFELIEKIIIDPAPAQPPRDPLFVNFGIDESYKRLKKFRMSSGLFFNNLVLNPPETTIH
ncbi:hypothetical protein RUM43_011161 [Polyplax serrata]|uniref:Adenylate kinase n=1 Tax=Polyplax serrata TaxID=468196 RepID=A0AAN8S016_POLSC